MSGGVPTGTDYEIHSCSLIPIERLRGRGRWRAGGSMQISLELAHVIMIHPAAIGAYLIYLVRTYIEVLAKDTYFAN